jgi:ATP-dependent Lon protease
VKSAIEILPVRWFDEVLDRALERKPVPLSDDAVAPPAAAPAPAEVRPLVTKH